MKKIYETSVTTNLYDVDVDVNIDSIDVLDSLDYKDFIEYFNDHRGILYEKTANMMTKLENNIIEEAEDVYSNIRNEYFRLNFSLEKLIKEIGIDEFKKAISKLENH